MAHVKICGVSTVEDAVACVRLGASAIGLNFVEGSPRRLGLEAARGVARAVHDEAARTGYVVQVVGVVAHAGGDPEPLRALARDVGLDCLQLHGDEPPELVAALLPHAYKAVRIATEDDVARADAYPGEHLLVDAKVEGALGGTGQRFDWRLVERLAERRKLTLAGGLDPRNVKDAVARVKPYCVDVASGVERSPNVAPGVKDLEKVRAFIAAARGA